MGEFRWSDTQGIDVSSYGKPPYRTFSPFSHHKTHQIPVPGDESTRADSVEGIWQGLKLINGVTDTSLFQGRAHKRKGTPEGHLYKGQKISYLDARKQLYVPAYTYHVVTTVLPHVWPDLEHRLEHGDVVMHDVETNGDINNPSSSLAHSAVLVQLLNVLKDAPLPKTPSFTPNPHASPFTYLHEQVDALAVYRKTLSPEDKKIFDDVITFAYLFSPDDHKQTLALRTIRAAHIETDRVKRYTPTERTKQPYEDCLRR